MFVTWILLSALLHAGWNALLRLEPDKDRGVIAIIALASTISGVIAVAHWRAGTPMFPTASGAIYTIVAGVLELVYFTALAKALDAGGLGPVYTVSRGGSVLLVWPLSIALMGEHVSVLSGTGSAILLAGLVLVGGNAPMPRRALWWAIVCGVAIALYHVAYKQAMNDGAMPAATFSGSLLLATLLNLVRIGRAGRRELRLLVRARWHRLALASVVCAGGFLLLMEGLATGGAGYTLTMRNTSVLFAVILSWIIGERPNRRVVFGVVLVALGAGLMGLG